MDQVAFVTRELSRAYIQVASPSGGRVGTRMVKIFKRRGNNIEADRRGARDSGHCGEALSSAGREEEGVSLALMVAFEMIMRNELG